MADINLLPVEEKASEKLLSIQKKFSVFSVVVLVVVAAFTVVTLILFTQEKSQYDKLKSRVEAAAGEVNENKPSEDLLTVVEKKAESANKVLEARLLYTEILVKTAELMPLGVSFSDLKVSGNKMSAGATAATSADVANLVSSFVTSDGGKKLFSSLSIDSLATNADNKYSFSVSMVLNPVNAGSVAGGAKNP